MAGDVLIATIAMGRSKTEPQPAFTPPTGWMSVGSPVYSQDTESALAVYWHLYGTGETSYTWQFNEILEGVAWISSYSGVSPTSPIDVGSGLDDSASSTSYSLPVLTTTGPGEMIVGAYAGHGSAPPGTWTAPASTHARTDSLLHNATTRSGLGIDALQGAAGTTPASTATVSPVQDYALTYVLALKPAH